MPLLVENFPEKLAATLKKRSLLHCRDELQNLLHSEITEEQKSDVQGKIDTINRIGLLKPIEDLYDELEAIRNTLWRISAREKRNEIKRLNAEVYSYLSSITSTVTPEEIAKKVLDFAEATTNLSAYTILSKNRWSSDVNNLTATLERFNLWRLNNKIFDQDPHRAKLERLKFKLQEIRSALSPLTASKKRAKIQQFIIDKIDTVLANKGWPENAYDDVDKNSSIMEIQTIIGSAKTALEEPRWGSSKETNSMNLFQRWLDLEKSLTSLNSVVQEEKTNDGEILVEDPIQSVSPVQKITAPVLTLTKDYNSHSLGAERLIEILSVALLLEEMPADNEADQAFYEQTKKFILDIHQIALNTQKPSANILNEFTELETMRKLFEQNLGETKGKKSAVLIQLYNQYFNAHISYNTEYLDDTVLKKSGSIGRKLNEASQLCEKGREQCVNFFRSRQPRIDYLNGKTDDELCNLVSSIYGYKRELKKTSVKEMQTTLQQMATSILKDIVQKPKKYEDACIQYITLEEVLRNELFRLNCRNYIVSSKNEETRKELDGFISLLASSVIVDNLESALFERFNLHVKTDNAETARIARFSNRLDRMSTRFQSPVQNGETKKTGEKSWWLSALATFSAPSKAASSAPDVIKTQSANCI